MLGTATARRLLLQLGVLLVLGPLAASGVLHVVRLLLHSALKLLATLARTWVLGVASMLAVSSVVLDTFGHGV